ncbi:MAG: VWA domain-containing protein [Acidobacteriota bacterium]
MKIAAIILLLLSLSSTSVVVGQFQQHSPSNSEEEESDAVIKVTTVNVGLPVTVFNEKGQFVPNLKRDNFRVFENNRPQPILEFQAQSDLPLNVALLMDTSTSVRNRLEFEKVAIKQFLGGVLQGSRDRVSFFTFDNTIQLREDFTNDIPKLLKTVDEIKVAGGQTSLYDAIHKVCREKMSRSSSRRRVIVAITDGADTNSVHTLDQAITIAQRTETSVYGISTKGGSVFRVEGSPYLNADDRDLRKLCRDTGGDVFFPDSPEELNAAFRLVTEFLRNQYWLVYEPSAGTDGKYREIEVRIVGKKGLSALTRRGYVAK